jgi:ankyrin repeat protein
MPRMLRKCLSYLVVCTLLMASGLATAQSLEDVLRAATDGDLVTLQKLIERGTSPDTSDPDGQTLLMLAARSGHLKVVQYLVEQKASVTRKSKVGDSALMVASLKGHVPVARFLIERGAEVNPPGWTPLHYAAFEGQAAMITFLLSKGADKDVPAPNEYTALMLAIRGAHEEAARTILYADPDVRYKTSAGDTAMKLAIQKGYAPIVDLLKRAGAVE